MKTFNKGFWLSAATASVLMAAVAHAATWDQKLAYGAHRVLIGDWNGDQHSDVLWQAKRPDEEHAAIFTAVQNANTQRWKDGHLNRPWNSKDINLVVGDFNGDLNSDILLQSITPALTSELIITEETGHIGVPTQAIGDWHLGLRWDHSSSRLLVGDFNGDGRDDLFLHGKDKNRHGLALANEQGQFQKLEFDFDNYQHNLDWTDKNATLNSGDFDGDGKFELLLQPSQSDGVVSTIGGTYQQGPLAAITQQWSAQHLGFDWSSRRHRIVVGDFNGDGKDDVFLLGTTKIDASVYLTASDKQFDTVNERIESIPNLDKLIDIIVADFDADGIDELVLVFDDKQNPLLLLLADGARRARLEALFRQNGLLKGSQSLGWLTGVAGTPSSHAIKTVTAASTSAVTQCSPTDPNCEVDCELMPNAPGCSGLPPSPYAENVSTVTESAYPSYSEFGIVNGAFKVDESGAANYNYPITTLPGAGNVAPKLALAYSSTGGNGVVGMGWSISGLSSISRCRRTTATDGYDDTIRFDTETEFCLDGQRLILRSDNRGEPGPWTFTTEIDGGSKITAAGGNFANPAYFTVRRKDGSISTYGDSADARNEVYNANGGYNTAKTLAWAISRLTDSASNYIEYAYTKNAGQQLLAEVRYTGNTRKAQDTYATLQFVYEDRIDARTFHMQGGSMRLAQRLKTVRSLNGSTEVRRTELSYAPFGRSPVSRLEFLQECAGTHCLPAIQFVWNVGLNRIESEFQSNNGNDFTHRFVGGNLGEFNADGKADLGYVFRDSASDGANDYWFTIGLMMQSTGKAYFDSVSDIKLRLPHSDPSSWHMLDYNGDGLTDLLSPHCTRDALSPLGYQCTGGYSNWGITVADPVKIFPRDSKARYIIPGQLDTGVPLTNKKQAEVADFDGNGLPDILFPKATDSHIMMIAFQDKPGREYAPNQTHSCANPASARPNCFATPVEVPMKLQAISNAALSSSTIISPDTKSMSAMDINGDGFSDLFLELTYTRYSRDPRCDKDDDFCKDANGQPISASEAKYKRALVLERTGPGRSFAFVEKGGSSSVLDWLPTNDDKRVKLADLNGDGLIDLIRGRKVSGYSTEWFTSLNNGLTFDDWRPTGLISPNRLLLTVDLNNDGLSDLIYASNDSTESSVSFLVRFQNSSGGFDAPIHSGWRSITDRFRTNMLGDFNGDGILDTVRLYAEDDTYGHSSQYIALSQDKFLARNTIKEIRTGVGNKTVIEYQPLTLPSVYTPRSDLIGSTERLQVMNIKAPMYVVSAAKSSSPSATNTPGQVDVQSMAEVRYHYEGLRMQAGGRGSLGFQKIYTFDPQSNVETETEFKQLHPYTGMPVATTKRLLSTTLASEERFGISHLGAKLLSESYNSGFSTLTTPQQGVMPFFTTTLDKSHEPNSGVQVTQTKTMTTFDNWGNVDLLVVENQTAAGLLLQKKITDNTFPSGDDGFLGRLSSTTVTTQRPGLLDEVRTSSFEYCSGSDSTCLNANSRQLIAETVEPNDTSSEKNRYLRTAYELDEFGNRVRTTVTSHPSLPSTSPYYINRSTRVVYDTQGRFVEEKYNQYGQLVEKVVERNTLYAPTQITGLNNVTITNEYTPMGRLSLQVDNLGSNGAPGTRKEIFLEKCGTGGVVCANASYAYRVRSVSNSAPDSEQYFDVVGREVLSVIEAMEGSDGDRVAKVTEYDVLSRVKRVSLPYFDNSAPAGWLVNDYDALGRLFKITNADGTDAGTTYEGLFTTYVNELGQTKKEERNLLGELIKVTDHVGNAISYSYDIAGRLDKMSRVGSTTLFQSDLDYDLMGRKTRLWDADKSPVAGTAWRYDYNAAGEIVKQTDARGYVTINTYDNGGRLVRRVEKDADSLSARVFADTSWTFDNGTAIVANNNSRSQLTQEYDAISQYKRLPTYDHFGRVIQISTTIEGKTWTESTAYDDVGRTDWSRDASGQGIKMVYTPRGFVREKQDLANSAIVYQRIEKMDAAGHVVEEKASSGALITKRTYSSLTGRLENISTIGNGQTLQNLSYTWDDIGNLKSRSDYSSGRNLYESFAYDNVNRLTHIGPSEFTLNEYVRYDAEGNITEKSDVTGLDSNADNNYKYGGSCNGIVAGPHAVTSVEGHTYCYDKNGNQLSGKGRKLLYDNTFDLPTRISTTKHTTEFVYGPSRQRLKRTDSNTTTGTATTFYVGNVEVIVKGNRTEYRRNLGNAVVNNGVVSYVLTDHLGSTHRVVNCNGGIMQNVSFDPFGDKRNAETWAKLYVDFNSVATMARSTEWLISPLSASRTLHGYTGHEQLDELGLVHMNGRVHDAKLGRFMQADPFIQDRWNSQNLNRYSYVLNNPLAFIDPSGYFNLRKELRRAFGTAVGITVGIYTGNWQLGLSIAYGGYKGAKAYEMGASVGDAFKVAIGSGLQLYGTVQGAFRAYNVGAMAWAQGSLKPIVGEVMHQYVAREWREEMARFAERHGMSLMELNLYLTGLSFAGDQIFGSRYQGGGMTNPETGERFEFIDGMTQRKGLGYDESLGFNPWSMPAELIDLSLGWQGLPSASGWGYIMSGDRSLPLVGYSLGALDVNNIAGWGFGPEKVYAISLPAFSSAAAGVQVINGKWDFVNGFGVLGGLFSPFSTTENVGFCEHSTYGYQGIQRWIGYRRSGC